MDRELRQQTKTGILWSAIQRFSTQGIQFLTTLIMARILTPAEYGTIGMLSIFLAVSSVFVDSGFVNALTRKQNRTHEDICTVFFFNISISCVFYALLFFSAPYISDFYNMPELLFILRVLGLTLIINSFAAVQATLLTIQIDFKNQTKISIIALLLSATIGITCAYKGFSYWALVIQNIVSCLISTILYWYFSKWRPTLTFSIKSFKEMFNFGSKLLLSSLIDSIYNNIYSLVIGKCFSASTLGNYSRADSYANFPSNSLTGVIQRVTYPVLCKMQEDGDDLAQTYRKFLRISAFFIFPLMMALSALSYPFIILLIGEQWSISASMLQILCFSLMWYPIHVINLNLLFVKGRSDLSLRLEIIKKILGISILTIAIPMGIMALCYSRIVMSILALIINTYYTGKLINLGFLKQIKDLMPTTTISISMFALIIALNSLNPNLYVQTAIGITIGGSYYVLMSYLFNKREWDTAISLIKK
jgi:O-antigen/teichoic acid export membrane protein